MAFGKDYHAIPESELGRAREMYEQQTKGNSDNKEVKERPKLKPLKETPVKNKKPSLRSKFREVFFINDPAVARERVFTEIFIPNVKDLFMNMMWGYFSSFLYDTPMIAPRGRSRADTYNRASDRGLGTLTRERNDSRRSNIVTDVGAKRMADDLIFDSMSEAQQYLDVFVDYISEYQVLSIGDVYDTCGLSHSYTDDRWGWRSLNNAYVQRLGGGKYTIYFPKAVPLK